MGSIKLTRKHVWIINCSVIILGLIILGVFLRGSHTIYFTAADLQKRIDAKLPLTVAKDQVRVLSATVHLTNSGLDIFADMEDTRTQDLRVLVHAIGQPVFTRRAGTLRFEAEKVNITSILWKGKSISARLLETAGMIFQGKPIMNAIEQRVALTERHVHSLAESGARTLINSIPMYRIKDDAKGYVLKMTLEKVEIRNGQLAVTFNAWALTIQLLLVLLAVLFALVMVGAMILNPELFLVVAIGSAFQ